MGGRESSWPSLLLFIQGQRRSAEVIHRHPSTAWGHWRLEQNDVQEQQQPSRPALHAAASDPCCCATRDSSPDGPHSCHLQTSADLLWPPADLRRPSLASYFPGHAQLLGQADLLAPLTSFRPFLTSFGLVLSSPQAHHQAPGSFACSCCFCSCFSCCCTVLFLRSRRKAGQERFPLSTPRRRSGSRCADTPAIIRSNSSSSSAGRPSYPVGDAHCQPAQAWRQSVHVEVRGEGIRLGGQSMHL